jgi:hypothetical protein
VTHFGGVLQLPLWRLSGQAASDPVADVGATFRLARKRTLIQPFFHLRRPDELYSEAGRQSFGSVCHFQDCALSNDLCAFLYSPLTPDENFSLQA